MGLLQLVSCLFFPS